MWMMGIVAGFLVSDDSPSQRVISLLSLDDSHVMVHRQAKKLKDRQNLIESWRLSKF